MTLNEAKPAMTRTVLQINLFFFALTALFINLRPTPIAGNTKSALPRSAAAHKAVSYSDAKVLHNVSVANVLNLPVVQQPPDNPYYVSARDGEATQFSVASRYGSVGLLAHNTLSGKSFSKLDVGQEVKLVYADGQIEHFVVAEILRFQALEPESVSSSFRSLDGNEILSAGDMFKRAYVGGHRLVFQTCIAAQGNVSWGRLFVVAMPKE